MHFRNGFLLTLFCFNLSSTTSFASIAATTWWQAPKGTDHPDVILYADQHQKNESQFQSIKKQLQKYKGPGPLLVLYEAPDPKSKAGAAVLAYMDKFLPDSKQLLIYRIGRLLNSSEIGADKIEAVSIEKREELSLLGLYQDTPTKALESSGLLSSFQAVLKPLTFGALIKNARTFLAQSQEILPVGKSSFQEIDAYIEQDAEVLKQNHAYFGLSPQDVLEKPIVKLIDQSKNFVEFFRSHNFQDNFFSVLVDAAALHDILERDQKTKVIVFVGTAHTTRLNAMLARIGYTVKKRVNNADGKPVSNTVFNWINEKP